MKCVNVAGASIDPPLVDVVLTDKIPSNIDGPITDSALSVIHVSEHATMSDGSKLVDPITGAPLSVTFQNTNAPLFQNGDQIEVTANKVKHVDLKTSVSTKKAENHDRPKRYKLHSLTGKHNEVITLQKNADPKPPDGLDGTKLVDVSFQNQPGKVRGRGEIVEVRDLKADPTGEIDLRKNGTPSLPGKCRNQHSGQFRPGDEVLLDGRDVVHKGSGVRVPRTDLKGPEEEFAKALKEMRSFSTETKIFFNQPGEDIRFADQMTGVHEHFDSSVVAANYAALKELANILRKYPTVKIKAHCDFGVPSDYLHPDGVEGHKAFHIESFYTKCAERRIRACIDELRFHFNLSTDESRFEMNCRGISDLQSLTFEPILATAEKSASETPHSGLKWVKSETMPTEGSELVHSELAKALGDAAGTTEFVEGDAIVTEEAPEFDTTLHVFTLDLPGFVLIYFNKKARRWRWNPYHPDCTPSVLGSHRAALISSRAGPTMGVCRAVGRPGRAGLGYCDCKVGQNVTRVHQQVGHCKRPRGKQAPLQQRRQDPLRSPRPLAQGIQSREQL